jgi:hypothetical protein
MKPFFRDALQDLILKRTNALRDLMLKYTSAEGFGSSGSHNFSFEWPATNYRNRWVLRIRVSLSGDQVVLSGEGFGITVCNWLDLPVVLEEVEMHYPAFKEE